MLVSKGDEQCVCAGVGAWWGHAERLSQWTSGEKSFRQGAPGTGASQEDSGMVLSEEGPGKVGQVSPEVLTTFCELAPGCCSECELGPGRGAGR